MAVPAATAEAFDRRVRHHTSADIAGTGRRPPLDLNSAGKYAPEWPDSFGTKR
jgi:hypothetical protein